LVVDHGFSSYQKKSTRFDGTLILKNKERSQAPPAKPEACELEPLKAAIVVR
jgi:hypothetical protein